MTAPTLFGYVVLIVDSSGSYNRRTSSILKDTEDVKKVIRNYLQEVNKAAPGSILVDGQVVVAEIRYTATASMVVNMHPSPVPEALGL